MQTNDKKHPPIKLSMLDLVAVREGHPVRHALETALRTAQHADRLFLTVPLKRCAMPIR